ncbi:MAG: two-component regulator propeller domain-containing protein [Salinivirgaceae bacterium]
MKQLVCYIVGLFWGLSLAAQTEYSFKHLTINQGLSNNQINCIFKDSRGFMWFGTSSGLDRYDGNSFKIFSHIQNDTNSIIDNNILNIQEDFQQNLWITTGSGYTVLNTQKERFIYPATKYLRTLGYNNTPAFVYSDDDRNFWVTSDKGECSRYDVGLKAWNKLERLPKEPISDMFHAGTTLYLVYTNGQIVHLNQTTLEVEKTEFLTNKFELPEVNSLHIFVDNDGDRWLYQETNPTGIYYYSNKTEKWNHLTNDPKCLYTLSSNTVKDITSDNRNQIWIATDHGGINLINKKTETNTHLEHHPDDKRSIVEKSMVCLYYDNENTLWAGSYKYGISYFSESIFKFKHIRLKVSDKEPAFDNDLNCFQEDREGNLWIGSNNKGLLRIDHRTGKQSLFQHQAENPQSLSNNVVVSLLNDSKNRLWVGTYQGGLNCYVNGRFEHYKIDNGNQNTVSNDNIWSLLEDSYGNLWIATLGGGLNKLDAETGRFRQYSMNSTPALSSNYVLCLHETHEKNLLIGTAHGLVIYYPAQDRFITLTGNFSGTAQFINKNIMSVFEDSRGLIWIGTRDGLNIINPKTDELTLLNKNTGIADNVICAILEDESKNLWVSTANGLSHLVVSTNPKTGEYHFIPSNYDERDGLQGAAFNERSAYRTSAGDLIFGGTNGYNLVSPGRIKYNRNRPNLVFTDFLLFNKPVVIDSQYFKRVILEKAISQTTVVDLTHQMNIFTIQFSALNYLQPAKTTYAYKLEGFDQDWVKTQGINPSATYTNLDEGSYTFLVKAANNDGFWSDEPIALTINVHPPIWKTNWAIFIYYLIITGIILLVAGIMRQRIRNRFQIAQERLEAKRNRELDQMKLRFFTNISHEFRTQISLVITPLDKLIKQTNDENTSKSLKMISRNANKLLQLVNQILDFRKMDAKGHKLNLAMGDAVLVIREICHSFAETYEKKNINLTFSASSEEIRMNFDEDKLSKIVSNLLSNAYKFTPKGGRIDVKISFTTVNNEPQLRVSIADTGIGVKAEHRSQIFERFFQENVPETKATGSGIGLHISKEFVELHGGTIWMEPNQQQGSVFVFTIPLVNTNTTDLETHEVVETLSPGVLDADGFDMAKAAKRKQTILIVDDNEDFRIFLHDNLQEFFEVLEAENGKKALEICLEQIPDMVISDVMMPELDGYELCKAMKSDVRSSHIPVILLTARTANEHIVQGLETGADEYITKPFNLDILLLRINKLLEQRAEVHHQITQKKEINPSEIKVSSLDEQLIDKAIKCVEENMDNSDFSVELLSQEMGMSRVHLYKKLLSITGKTPIEFIRILRLKRAAQLLGKSQLTVSEVAYQVGFNNPKYFSRYFKEEFGLLPSVYAEKNK